MRKEIYLIRGKETESYIEFKNRILQIAQAIPVNYDVDSLKITITETAPPTISVIPFSKKRISAISVFHNENQRIDNLINTEGFAGIYSVNEALPVKYKKNWQDNEVTPGLCLLSLFKKKRNIDFNTFIDRWHNSHTPLSLKIHPLWHYNRNVVDDIPGNQSEQWDGIVEEHVRQPSELLNPLKFFGNPLTMIPNMIKVYSDTKSFLDYKTIETYMVREYYIIS